MAGIVVGRTPVHQVGLPLPSVTSSILFRLLVMLHIIGLGLFVELRCTIYSSHAEINLFTCLTLLRPLLPYGYSYKVSCVRPG